MSTKNKFLYEFVVEREIEKEIPEKKMEGDQEVTIIRKEKVKEPVKFSILRPTRRTYDMAEIFLAKTISQFIKDGIMPITLIAKRFGNDGGVLTDEENKYVSELQTRLDQNQKELADLSADKTDEDSLKPEEGSRRADIILEMLKIQSEIEKLRNSYMSLYENTAEMKARKKTIEWWITQLSFVGGDKPKEYFEGDSFAERYEKYVNILDGDDDFQKKVTNKFTYLISTWFANAQTGLDEKDFQATDQHFETHFEG